MVPRAEPIERAEVGDIASVHYIGTLDNGEMFDTSRQEGRVPLEFEIGSGNVIAGFDKVVTGLAVGETNKLRVIPSDAYGDYSDELMMTFPKSVRLAYLALLSSVAVLAEILLRSPQKIFIFIIKKNIFLVKVSKYKIIYF